MTLHMKPVAMVTGGDGYVPPALAKGKARMSLRALDSFMANLNSGQDIWRDLIPRRVPANRKARDRFVRRLKDAPGVLHLQDISEKRDRTALLVYYLTTGKPEAKDLRTRDGTPAFAVLSFTLLELDGKGRVDTHPVHFAALPVHVLQRAHERLKIDDFSVLGKLLVKLVVPFMALLDTQCENWALPLTDGSLIFGSTMGERLHGTPVVKTIIARGDMSGPKQALYRTLAEGLPNPQEFADREEGRIAFKTFMDNTMAAYEAAKPKQETDQ